MLGFMDFIFTPSIHYTLMIRVPLVCVALRMAPPVRERKSPSWPRRAESRAALCEWRWILE